MPVLAALLAILLIAVVLWDVFQTIILPRRVSGRYRLTRAVYETTWEPWRGIAVRMRAGQRRESFLGYYGPLALIFLLCVWAVALILGFALLQWALGSRVVAADGRASFGLDLYFSGTTFFTLGLGDVAPLTPLARVVTVIEAGTGFGILASVIGYLPVLYQAFSRREASISLLDSRAGSPPSAVELLQRYGRDDQLGQLDTFLYEWERWSAELLESQVSYPSVGYFRSQHDNQSWLAALTTVLDLATLMLVGIDGLPDAQARHTFAMTRHAAVDLSQIFTAPPKKEACHRLPKGEVMRVRRLLAEAGVVLRDGDDADRKFAAIREKYEPYVAALSERLLMPLPPWIPPSDAQDDWQTSVYEHIPSPAFEAALED